MYQLVNKTTLVECQQIYLQIYFVKLSNICLNRVIDIWRYCYFQHHTQWLVTRVRTNSVSQGGTVAYSGAVGGVSRPASNHLNSPGGIPFIHSFLMHHPHYQTPALNHLSLYSLRYLQQTALEPHIKFQYGYICILGAAVYILSMKMSLLCVTHLTM